MGVLGGQTLILSLDEEIAHFGVPLLPGRAADMVHDMRGVIVVIKAVVAAGLRLAETVDAADDAAVSRARAEVEPAEQTDGRHRFRRLGSRVAVARAVGRG